MEVAEEQWNETTGLRMLSLLALQPRIWSRHTMRHSWWEAAPIAVAKQPEQWVNIAITSAKGPSSLVLPWAWAQMPPNTAHLFLSISPGCWICDRYRVWNHWAGMGLSSDKGSHEPSPGHFSHECICLGEQGKEETVRHTGRIHGLLCTAPETTHCAIFTIQHKSGSHTAGPGVLTQQVGSGQDCAVMGDKRLYDITSIKLNYFG